MLPSSILVKPVSARCNLACRYCFYSRRLQLYGPDEPGRMGDRVLEEMIAQYLDISTDIASFSWQGGEPLLAGLDFYKRAVKLQEAYGRGHAVSNAFQTNGTLLTEEWTRFFFRYKFLIGISLDGPPAIHDANRRTPRGYPSFRRAFKGAELLKRGGVDFNVLCVVNSVNAGDPEGIYEFFVGNGFRYLQFVPCLEWDIAKNGPGPYDVNAEQYGSFLCRVFDLWKRDYPRVYVRMFNSLLAMRLGRGYHLCTLGPSCGEYVVVESNGDVYPCDFFVDKEMRLGNILEVALRKIVEGTSLAKFSDAKSKVDPQCRSCEWIDLCFGGCQYNRRESAHPGRSYFCPAYKQFFSYSQAGFEEIEACL